MATTNQRIAKWSNRIAHIDDERGVDNGIWIVLAKGWQDYTNPTCHTIHEDTYQMCLDLVAMAIPCDCSECKGAELRA